MLSSLGRGACTHACAPRLRSLRSSPLLPSILPHTRLGRRHLVTGYPATSTGQSLTRPSFRTSTSTSTRRASASPPSTPAPSASVLGSGSTGAPTFAGELQDPARFPSPPALAPPSILDRILPSWAERAKPYLLLTRIDKPIGSVLLYWPCAWAITMASTVNHLPPSVPAFYMALFGVGAVIMRGAGCTINDMWDEKFDKAVERTQWRPLAKGDVTQFNALVFLGAQLSAGLAVLTQLNWYSILLGASSLSLVVIYPFMKRITYYPQITLGLAFNWGALLGWSAVAGSVDWACALPMYAGGVAWCVMYDTIYAHQDKKDDVLVGVKSIALRFPDSSRALISGLSATFVSLMAVSGELAGLGPLYYLISCGGAAAHLAWQCAKVNFDSRPDLWSKFCSNGWLGGLVWLGIAADYLQRIVIPGAY